MHVRIHSGWLVGLIIYAPVNSYGHVGMVSSPNHIFFLGKLDLVVNQYFLHILLLVTDNNPSWISGREENGGRNYFIIELNKSIGPGRDWTHNPCDQLWGHWKITSVIGFLKNKQLDPLEKLLTPWKGWTPLEIK